MASGLLALLDDVAAIAKVAAASVDDVAALSGRAATKAAGIVIDDAAVTPRYVVGFSADRELPIIGRIAAGSLRNKLLILLPAALALAYVAPWAITPLLVLGGLYLCFEGAEKLLGKFLPHHEAEKRAAEAAVGTPEELERARVAGAIRTDFILSAEIMAITLSTLPEGSFWLRAAVLAVVAVLITVAVYGAVALIVKADDVGVRLAQRGDAHWVRALGRGIVAAMPMVLAGLAAVGTLAMLWVGGGIVLHGMEEFGLEALPHLLHEWEEAVGGGLAGWLLHALASGVVGLILGGLIVGALTLFRSAPQPTHA